MQIYIAASWKHEHAVVMLTSLLRACNHKVMSFVENNNAERPGAGVKFDFESWCWSELGKQSFVFDTDGASLSDVVIYIGPSGKDAAAEIGVAWASGIPILGLYAKGEDFGLMRRMIEWQDNIESLLEWIAVRQVEMDKRKE